MTPQVWFLCVTWGWAILWLALRTATLSRRVREKSEAVTAALALAGQYANERDALVKSRDEAWASNKELHKQVLSTRAAIYAEYEDRLKTAGAANAELRAELAAAGEANAAAAEQTATTMLELTHRLERAQRETQELQKRVAHERSAVESYRDAREKAMARLDAARGDATLYRQRWEAAAEAALDHGISNRLVTRRFDRLATAIHDLRRLIDTGPPGDEERAEAERHVRGRLGDVLTGEAIDDTPLPEVEPEIPGPPPDDVLRAAERLTIPF